MFLKEYIIIELSGHDYLSECCGELTIGAIDLTRNRFTEKVILCFQKFI